MLSFAMVLVIPALAFLCCWLEEIRNIPAAQDARLALWAAVVLFVVFLVMGV